MFSVNEINVIGVRRWCAPETYTVLYEYVHTFAKYFMFTWNMILVTHTSQKPWQA
jgi:hypothetical protein